MPPPKWKRASFRKLGEWATADEETLASRTRKRARPSAGHEELALARCLFAAVIDAPGGLAIMTIHGFCERVLRRYSFEANVPPGFSVLTEEEARDALNEARPSLRLAAKSGLCAMPGRWLSPMRESTISRAALAGHARTPQRDRAYSCVTCR